MASRPFVCPICGRESWHPEDAEHGWCSACQGVTAEPPPPGLVWVRFVGGGLDGCGRLVRGDHPAAEYHRIGNGEVYAWDETDDVYRLTSEP